MKARPFFGLIQRRECLLPTWRGWLLIALVGAALAVGAVRGIYGFLAVADPIPGGILVIEGWVPDYAVGEVLAEFRQNGYAGIFATGLPLEQGAPLAAYRTYAELTAAILIRLGADPGAVHAVPAAAVAQDRTYASALALRASLRERGLESKAINVVTLGAHSRRTRLLYEKAFGASTRIGMIAIPHRDFEPARWWRSSQGFRIITGELIAYFYARFLFHPAPQAAPATPP